MKAIQAAVAIFSLTALTFLPGIGRAQEPAASPPDGSRSEAPLTPPVIRRVVVIGTMGLKAEDVTNAARGMTLGKPGSDTTVQSAVQSIVALYRKKGFPIAQVVGSAVADDGTLTLTVAEGTIRHILIRGNAKTLSGVIRAAVAMKPGDPYREDRVRDARNRLSRLGVFEDVVIVGAIEGSEKEKKAESDDSKKSGGKHDEQDADPKKDEGSGEDDKKPDSPPASSEAPGADNGKPTPDAPISDEVGFVDLIVSVKEEHTGNIAATVGYNDGTGLIGFFDFSERNVAGTANSASVQWQRTTTATFNSDGSIVDGRTRSAYLVSYDVPALGPRSTAVGGEVYNTNTVFLPFFSNNSDNIRNYELRKGGKFRVGRSFGRGGTIYLTGRHDEVGYDPVPDSLNPPVIDLINANATIAAYGANLILDGRDSADNPRHGYLNSFSYEQAGHFLGGDRNYGEAQVDLRSYSPLGPKKQSPLLALRFIGGTEGTNAPLSEQFWLGGYDLLRGYNLYSIRGTRMLMTSAEVRVPLGPGFQGALFTDIGNAYLPGEPVDISDLKASGGVGLRFQTPIGPIRLDVAYGDRVETYVSLGQSY